MLIRSLEGNGPMRGLLCLLKQIEEFVSEIFVVEFHHDSLLGQLRPGWHGCLRDIGEVISDMRRVLVEVLELEFDPPTTGEYAVLLLMK
jgi:hypothetical protein